MISPEAAGEAAIGGDQLARMIADRTPEQESPRLRIASIPGVDDPNPYIRLFYGALRRHSIVAVPDAEASEDWLLGHRHGVDAIHLHWPEKIWRSHRLAIVEKAVGCGIKGAWRLRRTLTPVRQVCGMRKLIRLIAAAKRCGTRIIWTYHNAEPHEGAWAFTRLGYARVAAAADLIICHSHSAREECLGDLAPSCPVVVMRMGDYAGVYPDPGPRDATLGALGLSRDVPLVASLGSIRRYKGFDVACRAALKLEGRVQYVVAGAADDRRYCSELQALANDHPWIKVLPGFLGDQGFADLTAAGDAIILPYRQITGSSALLAALTFRRGVVASDLPFFRETLSGEPDAGRLTAPNDAEALAQTIANYLQDVPPHRRSAAAERVCRRHRWSDVIQPVMEILDEWAAPRTTLNAGSVLDDVEVAEAADPLAIHSRSPGRD
jgi:glycosyltransferase involved in cell wall biosynthesis